MINSYEKRKQILIHEWLNIPYAKDIYGSKALLDLYLGVNIEQANAELANVAGWFVREHPKGREPVLECDFAALRLAGALYSANLMGETFLKIKDFFLGHDFESEYASENHLLIFHTARLLAAQKLKQHVFKAYGKDGETLYHEEVRYIKDFICFRANNGWAEFDSVCYMIEIFACLANLSDLAEDESLRIISRQMMDVLLVDYVLDSLDGLYGGAHGRIYDRMALNHSEGAMLAVYYLFFGHSYQLSDRICVELLITNYFPCKEVYSIVQNRTFPCENFESSHLHSITQHRKQVQTPQQEGYISKYTYCTDQYIIGAVNMQDDYEKNSPAAWYAQHQQLNWDLTIKGGTDIKVFTHHPGTDFEPREHGNWTGDLGCLCGEFFCNKSTLLATYHIGKDKADYIHAYVPLKYFEQIESKDHYLFLKRNDINIMLFFTNPYEILSDTEVRSKGYRQGVVCQVGEGDFNDFIKKIYSDEIYFDEGKMILSYRNMKIEPKKRFLNGDPVVFPYPTYFSDYMMSNREESKIKMGNLSYFFK